MIIPRLTLTCKTSVYIDKLTRKSQNIMTKYEDHDRPVVALLCSRISKRSLYNLEKHVLKRLCLYEQSSDAPTNASMDYTAPLRNNAVSAFQIICKLPSFTLEDS